MTSRLLNRWRPQPPPEPPGDCGPIVVPSKSADIRSHSLAAPPKPTVPNSTDPISDAATEPALPYDRLAEVGVPEPLAAAPRVLTTAADLADVLDEVRQDCLVGFDTEFVSESFYRPQLCLLQFATLSRMVCVDPFTCGPLDDFWAVMADPDITKIVHGGREELRFCLNAHGRPQNVIDVQVAQGFLGRSFPMAYKAICQKTIGVTIDTHETRTDWSRRPLSPKQIRYALEDVEHLHSIAWHQYQQLDKLDRLDWAEAEFERLVDTVESEPERDNFRKVSGVTRLRGAEVAVVDALHRYRREEAERLNKPVKHVLRDDLLIDIARRQPKTVAELFHTRGMNRKFNDDTAATVVEVVADALRQPKASWPKLPRPPKAGPGDDTLTKLLAIALSDRCARLEVAMSLVGSQSDIQDVVRHHAKHDDAKASPKLLTGWRKAVCGSLLSDLLDGRVSIRVGDPKKADPLTFELVE